MYSATMMYMHWACNKMLHKTTIPTMIVHMPVNIVEVFN